MELPEPLAQQDKELRAQFAEIGPTWKEYEDQIIPQDNTYAKKIVQFLVDALSYVEENDVDINEWKDFIEYYYYNFYYGPYGDDRNYLDIDEANVVDLFLELQNKEEFSKETAASLKKELQDVLSLL